MQKIYNIKVFEEKGITLIGLATTIIVLMILAGTIIVSNSGNEETLKLAQDKKEETEILLIKEEIKTALTNNPPSNFNELITFVKNYGTVQNESDPETATLITGENEYNILIKDIWNVSITNAGVQLGDYITYTSESGTNYTCRVFYINNQSGEIELIPINIPTSLTMEVNGLDGFNNFVLRINSNCNTLFSNNTLGITARGMGIKDIEKITTNTESLKGENYGKTQVYKPGSYPNIFNEDINNDMQDEYVYGYTPVAELNTKEDYYYGKIEYADEIYKSLMPTGNYWLASRAIKNDQNVATYYARTLIITNEETNLSGEAIYNSVHDKKNAIYGYLPIITLSENTIITDGIGTQEIPYRIK